MRPARKARGGRIPGSMQPTSNPPSPGYGEYLAETPRFELEAEEEEGGGGGGQNSPGMQRRPNVTGLRRRGARPPRMRPARDIRARAAARPFHRPAPARVQLAANDSARSRMLTIPMPRAASPPAAPRRCRCHGPRRRAANLHYGSRSPTIPAIPMPRRIAERFLDDPVDVDRAVLAHAVERPGGREVRADSGLPLELLDGAFDRAGQAEVVEHARVQPL